MTKKNIIGGSQSYLNVINSQDICCSETQNNISNNPNYKFPKLKLDNITAKDIVNNYGISNKTTGGGSLKESQKNIKKFLKKVVDNRILDVYLKYMGIKTLTTSTLVPIALIMGKDTLVEAINFIINSDNQKGGGNFLENKIPILDDELIGNYLKIAGLTTLNLSISTLLPIGILMSLYEIYNNNNKKVGGGKYITGQSIPRNIIQDIGSAIQGQPSFPDGIHGYSGSRSLSYHNNDMQLFLPEHQFNSSDNLLQGYNINVPGFKLSETHRVEFPEKTHFISFDPQNPINENPASSSPGETPILGEPSRSPVPNSSNPGGTAMETLINEEVGIVAHPEPTQAWTSDIFNIPDSMAGGGDLEKTSISTEQLINLANPLLTDSDDDFKSLSSDSDNSENELVDLNNKLNFFTSATDIKNKE